MRRFQLLGVCLGLCSLVTSLPRRTPPKIAVLGRPNVGKSTIVNRMTGKFNGGGLVHDEPGVTRDRTYGLGFWGAHEFMVVDTGGLVFDDDPTQTFMPQIRQQASLALAEAAVAVMVVDGQMGCTPLDADIADFLRKQKVPTVLAVNKCESTKNGDLLAADFWQLGIGTPWPVSGIHGTGMGDLMDAVVEPLPPNADESELEEDEPLKVAIIGKPNVGKSSLLNRLAGEERAIVSDIAGTTRDVIDQQVTAHGRRYIFLDTAGVRRAARVSKGVEQMMVQRSLKAARRSDVCLLVLDATETVSDQETTLANFIAESGRACVVVVNKWDAIAEKDDKLYRTSKQFLQNKLPSVSWAQQLFVSAKTGLKTQQIYNAIGKAVEKHRTRISTAVLNEVLEDAVRWQRPPSTSTGRQGSVYYCAQVSTRPPTIVIFCNDPDLFGQSYRRYLESQLRKSLGFEGTPIRLLFRARRAQRGAPGEQA
uniref:GTPase Der n=1 Tax=Chrysotila carterae TaxID=13221 RepID=A0A7S4FA39_CHRCT